MKVRLGFAIAAQMEPDVLIIDEVLAVGDLGFVLKCFKTIDTILPKTAIIFVSHSMPMVSRICSEIILMENGIAKFQGEDVAKGIDLYYTRFVNNESNVVFDDGSISLEDVQLLDPTTGESTSQLNWGEDLKLYFKFKFKRPFSEVPIFKIIIFDKEQRPVAILKENDKDSSIEIKNNVIEFVISHKNIQLSKGVYLINTSIHNYNNHQPILRINSILSFQMIHNKEVWQPFLLNSTYIDY